MKVSLDACLLGALCSVSTAHTILDIGTGTGLLALMVAQRSHAQIDAVELDEDAAEQANGNFLASPFHSRLHIYQQSIQTFQNLTPAESYDVIICNPPFFSQHLTSENKQRNLARHNDSLSFSDLSACITKLLKPNAEAWLLLPQHEHEHFSVTAKNQGLNLIKRIDIYARQHKPSKLGIWVYSKQEVRPCITQDIIIYQENSNVYTAEFSQLLADYYLKL
jgi:tRNA1Val (adenine37-N6)-methyltransferase